MPNPTAPWTKADIAPCQWSMIKSQSSWKRCRAKIRQFASQFIRGMTLSSYGCHLLGVLLAWDKTSLKADCHNTMLMIANVVQNLLTTCYGIVTTLHDLEDHGCHTSFHQLDNTQIYFECFQAILCMLIFLGGSYHCFFKFYTNNRMQF